MIKVLNENSGNEQTKNVMKLIDKIDYKLSSLKEDVQIDPNMYDIDDLISMLYRLYDEFGAFNIIISEI